MPGYSESTLDQTLDDLAQGRQGFLWLLHGAREGERADIMVMVIDTGTSTPECGLAQQILANRETAFLTVERRCLHRHTLAHEIGHLLEADHDPENATLDPPRFAHGHGYRVKGEVAPGWRTAIALECNEGICPRVNLWPSPLIQHERVPTGSAELHDNVRVLRETKAIVAGFYPDPASHEPGSPGF